MIPVCYFLYASLQDRRFRRLLRGVNLHYLQHVLMGAADPSNMGMGGTPSNNTVRYLCNRLTAE